MQPTIVCYVVIHSPKMIFIGFRMVGLFFLAISFLGPVPPAFFDILLVEVSMIGAQSSFSVKELLIFFFSKLTFSVSVFVFRKPSSRTFLKIFKIPFKIVSKLNHIFQVVQTAALGDSFDTNMDPSGAYYAAADKNHRVILCRKISSSDTSAIQERCWQEQCTKWKDNSTFGGQISEDRKCGRCSQRPRGFIVQHNS